MTPQEKAKQLVYKFQDEGSKWYFEKNKQFALIVVDEMLDELDNPNGWGIDTYGFSERINYWQNIKQEIEKL